MTGRLRGYRGRLRVANLRRRAAFNRARVTWRFSRYTPLVLFVIIALLVAGVVAGAMATGGSPSAAFPAMVVAFIGLRLAIRASRRGR